MSSLKLVTFRIDEEEWKQFLECATAKGESASSLLVKFCKWTNQGNSLGDSNEQDSIDQRLETAIDAKIATAIAPEIDNIDERITAAIDAAFAAFTPKMIINIDTAAIDAAFAAFTPSMLKVDKRIAEAETRIVERMINELSEISAEPEGEFAV